MTASTGGRAPTGGSSASGGTSGKGLVTAALKITSTWSNGYCASVDVVNQSAAKVTNWTVGINFPSSSLTNLWSGTPSFSGSIMSVAAASYNQQVASGASVNFGFCASTTGSNYAPSIASVSYKN